VTVRVLNFLGERAAARIRAVGPDVEVVDVPADEPPPPGLHAEVAFGGWGDVDHVLAWLRGAGVTWLQLPGTGIDGVHPDLLAGRLVTNSPGASAIPISEFVLAAILAVEKRIPDVWLHEPPERWNFFRMGGLDGRTLALVGLGGIGTAIARRALPFGMHVRALRRTDRPSPVPGVEVVRSLEALLPGAQHLVLAAPATRRTRHLIDARAFSLVEPGVHLVNIARGALVDQEALRAALDDGRVAAATLDTVEPEPLPAGHWLYEHPRVRLSAHVSWCSDVLLDRSIEMFVDNLRRYLAGGTVEHVVDLEEGY